MRRIDPMRTLGLFCIICFPALATAQTTPLPAPCVANATSCRIDFSNGGSTTSSVIEHHNTGAVVGTEVGTIAAMVYLFEIRPELQRLHNEKINAIEGEFHEEYQELDNLIATSSPENEIASREVSVHGLRLGEDWQEFTASLPQLKSNVARCNARTQPKQTRKHRVFDPCADFRHLEQGAAGKIIFSCRESKLATDLQCRDFNGEVTFIDSKLAALKIILPGITLDDAVAKFGPPSGMDTDKTSEIWHSPFYAAAADQMSSGIALFWANQSEYDLIVKRQLAIAAAMNDSSRVTLVHSDHTSDF